MDGHSVCGISQKPSEFLSFNNGYSLSSYEALDTALDVWTSRTNNIFKFSL